MEIEPTLLQYGITEFIINFFHSRTKNSHMTIVKVYKATDFSLLMDGQEGIRVNVTLKENQPFGEDIIHHAQYTIDVAKIRQKRLNLLLKTK
jgi:hypothetical protein